MRFGSGAVIPPVATFATARALQCLQCVASIDLVTKLMAKVAKGAPKCSQSGALGDQMANLFAKGARRLLCAPLCSVTTPTAIGATGICQVRTALGPVASLVAKATHHHGSAERHLVEVSEN
jgi:hypothetical protein